MRAWRRSQPLTRIKAADERKSLNPDQWKTAAVLLGLKSPHPLLLIGARAELLMNELLQRKSFKTHCFALLHMLITSAEDVDAFPCFPQSGRTCKLDVRARGRRGSDFIWLDAVLEPKFSLSDASASSRRSSNIPAESGISQPKMEVVQEGKHGFSIQVGKQNMHFTDETSPSGSGGVSHARKYDWSCVQVLYTHVSWNQDHVKHL